MKLNDSSVSRWIQQTDTILSRLDYTFSPDIILGTIPWWVCCIDNRHILRVSYYRLDDLYKLCFDWIVCSAKDRVRYLSYVKSIGFNFLGDLLSKLAYKWQLVFAPLSEHGFDNLYLDPLDYFNEYH